MTRTFTLSAIVFVGLASLAHAQTGASSPSKCGPETWSNEKMAYVNVPCVGGEPTAQGGASSSSNCGTETWSNEKMAYVNVPCTGGGQPAAAPQQASARTDLQYCGALVARYDQYLNKSGKSAGMQSANNAANIAAAKCRAGDVSGIGDLEKALKDAQVSLPPRS